MKKNHKLNSLAGVALATAALACSVLADDKKKHAELEVSAEIAKQLKAAGLDDAMIKAIEDEIASEVELSTNSAGGVRVEVHGNKGKVDVGELLKKAKAGDAKGAVSIEKKAFVVGADGEMKEVDLGKGEGAQGISELLESTIEIDGAGKVDIGKLLQKAGVPSTKTASSIESKAFVVGPDGEMREIDLEDGEGNEGIGAMLKAIIKIDGEEIDFNLDAADGGVFGIGPAVILGGDAEEIQLELDADGTGFDALVDQMQGARSKGVRSEIEELRAELAEQRQILEQILEAVK